MATYTIGHDDALLPCEQVWWAKALDAVRYAAERVPMETGRVITVFEIALAITMAVHAAAGQAME